MKFTGELYRDGNMFAGMVFVVGAAPSYEIYPVAISYTLGDATATAGDSILNATTTDGAVSAVYATVQFQGASPQGGTPGVTFLQINYGDTRGSSGGELDSTALRTSKPGDLGGAYAYPQGTSVADMVSDLTTYFKEVFGLESSVLPQEYNLLHNVRDLARAEKPEGWQSDFDSDKQALELAANKDPDPATEAENAVPTLDGLGQFGELTREPFTPTTNSGHFPFSVHVPAFAGLPAIDVQHDIDLSGYMNGPALIVNPIIVALASSLMAFYALQELRRQ